MPMACARSALEWPNSFYPENVFRVTLPRKSKFGGLNWVLFHALRSLDCPLQQPRLLLQPSIVPTILQPVLPLPLTLDKRRNNVLAFSSEISSVVQPATCTFLLYFWPFLPPFLLIKIAGRYGSRRAMQWEVRVCKRTRPWYNSRVYGGVSMRYLRHFTEYFVLLDRV